jgi:hypothetical protein
MLNLFRKAPARRAEIRKNRPDTVTRRWELMRASGVPVSLAIAAAFALIAIAILSLREDVVPHRPGQFAAPRYRQPRQFHLPRRPQARRRPARRPRRGPSRVHRGPALWGRIEDALLRVPDRVATAATPDELPDDLRKVIDSGTFDYLKSVAARPIGRSMTRRSGGTWKPSVRTRCASSTRASARPRRTAAS